MRNGNVESPCGRIGAWLRAGGVVASLAILGLAITKPTPAIAQGTGPDAGPIKSRHVGAARSGSTQLPRSEGDQAIVDGWPLYRTERGQAAFNDAMAALKATDGPAPTPTAFKGCAELACNLELPTIGVDGWIPAGRIWMSASDYLLMVQSPRVRNGRTQRRHPFRAMRYFVFHEFHNSSRNVDPYDTISSHSSSVFVPFYMSKPSTDAAGRRFVIVVQVAPYDVVSVHASNRGSAGPGIEVARNVSDQIEPLQNSAGVVVAAIVKAAAPHLQVVNHRGTEGQPMLSAWERRLTALRARPGSPAVTLPFVAASPQRLATVASTLDDLILRRGESPRIPIAERGIVPGLRRSASLVATASAPRTLAPDEPALIEPIRRAVPPPCAPGRALAPAAFCGQ